MLENSRLSNIAVIDIVNEWVLHLAATSVLLYFTLIYVSISHLYTLYSPITTSSHLPTPIGWLMTHMSAPRIAYALISATERVRAQFRVDTDRPGRLPSVLVNYSFLSTLPTLRIISRLSGFNPEGLHKARKVLSWPSEPPYQHLSTFTSKRQLSVRASTLSVERRNETGKENTQFLGKHPGVDGRRATER